MMNPSPEEFSRLRKLLALKRREPPPPGYFEHFSDKVIARIEAEGLCARNAWWQRLFPEWDAKPVLACAYGLVIMGLLAVGVGVSQSLDTEEAAAPDLGQPWFAQAPASDAVLPVSISVAPSSLTGQTNPASSVNPVISSGAPSFLFDVNRLKDEVERVKGDWR
jgi:hypothetical protein